MEFWFSEFHTPDVKHSIRVNKQLYSKQSDYQRIDIFETPEFGRVLTLDGNVMLTERDEFIYDEMIVHVPMAVHKEAKDILVIGAGDGGVVRELTRYDRVTGTERQPTNFPPIQQERRSQLYQLGFPQTIRQHKKQSRDNPFLVEKTHESIAKLHQDGMRGDIRTLRVTRRTG